MTAYLLSATGVIFLSVIVSLIIPEGKLNKTIVFIMRLCCIFVLIRPITGIFKTESEATREFVDYGFVGSVYSENQSEQLENLIYEKFGKECGCEVTVEYSDGEFSVSGASVEVYENNDDLIDKIYAYLKELGYINISVYAKTV